MIISIIGFNHETKTTFFMGEVELDGLKGKAMTVEDIKGLLRNTVLSPEQKERVGIKFADGVKTPWLGTKDTKPKMPI